MHKSKDRVDPFSAAKKRTRVAHVVVNAGQSQGARVEVAEKAKVRYVLHNEAKPQQQSEKTNSP